MNISRRGLLGTSVPIVTAGSISSKAVASRLSAGYGNGVPDVRTFEDFGAAGDYDLRSASGTDDTVAIQAALDWAYNDAKGPPRAIAAGSRSYLCGQITTYPFTTIIGTGRQTTMFVCKPGTTGAWWSDRGQGAQKLMLAGLAWYAEGESGLSSICRFGRDGVQLGSESIMEGLWLRDAPNATALDVSGNVAILRDITLQNADTGLFALGNANQFDNIFAMQCRVGANLSGCFLRGLHVEAVRDGGVPLRMTGDCRVSDTVMSLAGGTSLEHLIEIDPRHYDHWSIANLQVFGRDAQVRRSIFKVGNREMGGRDLRLASGVHIQPSLQLHGDRFSVDGHMWRCFSLEIYARKGQVRSTLANASESDSTGEFNDWIRDSGTVMGNRFVLPSPPINRRGFALAANLQRNSTGIPLTVEAGISDDARQQLQLKLYHGLTGRPFDLQTIPEGGSIVVQLSGFGG